MKNRIIISINPEYVEKILSGAKKFEYRTKAAKKDIDKIIIYETTPIKMVVAEAEILDVLIMKPNDLWEHTKEYSGISKDFFDEYFKGRSIAYAYKIGKVTRYPEPIELSKYGIKSAPQSFIYLKS
ncbi:MAG: ASCH domain-containing protein [Bacilli bacterium]|nr:ASCH domain-containing protein [Bacilli bacterium]